MRAGPVFQGRRGSYVTLGHLAVGGMCDVVLARAPDGAQVVVKSLSARWSGDAEARALLAQERQILARCRHPNIVELLDAGWGGGRPFLVLEHVPGGDLTRLVARSAARGMPVPAELVAGIALRVLEALRYVAALDDGGRPLTIVHRDVSPMNVLLTASGGVKLVDFGVASVEGVPEPEGVLRGKIPYLAPELFRGAPPSPRSDLWALGVTLWEVLAGRHLFHHESRHRTLTAILREPVPRLGDLRSDLPAPLRRWVHWLLEHEPHARPLDERDAAESLELLARDEGWDLSRVGLARRLARLPAARSLPPPIKDWSPTPRASRAPPALPRASRGPDPLSRSSLAPVGNLRR